MWVVAAKEMRKMKTRKKKTGKGMISVTGEPAETTSER